MRRRRGLVRQQDHARRRDADRGGGEGTRHLHQPDFAGRIFASAEIAKVYAAGQSFRDRAAGFVAIPISRTPRDCLIFFRREVLRSVNWAGAPEKVYDEGRTGRA